MIKRIIILTLFMISFLFGHCQVPCGIYDDAVRIVQMKEDVETIRKSMIKINELSKNNESAQDMNQMVRWVNTKEDHAQKIQSIISDYFLTQRIKFKKENEDGRELYVQQTIILQQLLVAVMKCKQTVIVNNCDIVLALIDGFTHLYFDEHGLKHIQEISTKQ